MNNIKNSGFFRVVSLALIFSFILLDISWAYPPGENTQNNNLAIWSNFQQPIFVKEAGSALVIRSIADNLFGNPEEGGQRFPLRNLGGIVAADLAKISEKAPEIMRALETIDVSRVATAKWEGGKFIEEELDKDKFVPNDAILLVPYRKDGMDRIIQIALKGSPNANALIGEEASFLLGERFVVRDVPKDWKGSAQAPAEVKEASKLTVSEPVAVIEIPAAISETETANTPQAPRRTFTIRAIISSLALMILTTLYALAGEPVAGATRAGWQDFRELKDYTFSHPIFTLIAGGIIGWYIYKIAKTVNWKVHEHRMYRKAISNDIASILEAARSGDLFAKELAFRNLKTIKGVDVLAGLLKPSLFPVDVLAIFRGCIYTAEEATALERIITKLVKETKIVTGEEPIYNTGMSFRGSRGSDGDWSEESERIGYSDVTEIIGDYSAIIALSKNPTELRQLIDEELAKQTKSESTHNFTASSGYNAAAVTSLVSLTSFVVAAAQYMLQGDFTGVTIAAVLAGAYFGWAAARYFGMGKSASDALVKSGLTRKEARTTAIARNDGYRHPAYVENRFITLHEGFEQHWTGMLGVMPIISWFFRSNFEDSIRRAELYAKANSENPDDILEAINNGDSNSKAIALKNIANINDIDKLFLLWERSRLYIVRSAVAQNFGSIKDPRATKLLGVELVSNPSNYEYKLIIIEALNKINSLEARVYLRLCDYRVEVQEIIKLHKEGDILPFLIGVLNDKSYMAPVNAKTIKVIGQLKDVRAVPFLMKYLKIIEKSGVDFLENEIIVAIAEIEGSKTSELVKKKLGQIVKERLDNHTHQNGALVTDADVISKLPEQVYSTVIDKIVDAILKIRSANIQHRIITESVKVDYDARKCIKQSGGYYETTDEEVQYGADGTTLKSVWVETSPAVYSQGHFTLTVDLQKLDQLIAEEIAKQNKLESGTAVSVPQTAILEGVAPKDSNIVIGKPVQPEASDVEKVRQLFEIVESALNNNRARLADAGNELVTFLAERDKLPAEADLLLVLGSDDLGVAKGAAELYKSGKTQFKYVMCSGRGKGETSEGQRFTEEMIANGVPRGAFLLPETNSRFMGENLSFTAKQLAEAGKLGEMKSVVVVQTPLYNRQAKAAIGKNFVTEAGKVATQICYVYAPSTPKMDTEKTALELKEQMGQALAAADNLKTFGDKGWIDKTELPADISSAAQKIREGLSQLDADSIVTSLIVMARRAKDSKNESQKLIVGISTDWIPAYKDEHSFQYQATNSLVNKIKALPQALKSMGLDNVELVIEENSSTLASNVSKLAQDSNARLSNVVVIASREAVEGGVFDKLRDENGEEKALLAGMDSKELMELYKVNGEISDKVLDIDIMEILALTLEVATGKTPPRKLLAAPYDSAKRILILSPRATIKDYQKLRDVNEGRKQALQAA